MRFRLSWLCLRVVCAATVMSSQAFADAQRPVRSNMLFIMSDDHTAQAVGAYATVLKSLNPTPELDRLAAGGMPFARLPLLFWGDGVKVTPRANPMARHATEVTTCFFWNMVMGNE